jgi:hypothetical protein
MTRIARLRSPYREVFVGARKAETPLEEARAQFDRGTLLRIGDILQTFPRGEYEMLCKRGKRDVWIATGFPVGLRIGGGCAPPPWSLEDSRHPPWEGGFIPADFAERAALDGRLIYPVDPWSTWPEEASAPPRRNDSSG